MIELIRTEDEEVGDGTTSVIVLVGEMLHVAEAFIDKSYHPIVICRAYIKALEDVAVVLDKSAMPIDTKDRATMLGLVKSYIGTEFTSQFGDLITDAMSEARNTIKNPKLVTGGGGAELTVSATLKQKSPSIEGIEKWSYEAVAIAFEAILQTLAQNCGVNVIRTMTTLQGKHANGENAWIEIDGNTGAIADMKEKKIWDAYNVKAQTFKTAIEAACMLLRIDNIMSGIKKKQPPGAGAPSKPQVETEADANNDKKNVYSG